MSSLVCKSIYDSVFQKDRHSCSRSKVANKITCNDGQTQPHCRIFKWWIIAANIAWWNHVCWHEWHEFWEYKFSSNYFPIIPSLANIPYLDQLVKWDWQGWSTFSESQNFLEKSKDVKCMHVSEWQLKSEFYERIAKSFVHCVIYHIYIYLSNLLLIDVPCISKLFNHRSRSQMLRILRIRNSKN